MNDNEFVSCKKCGEKNLKYFSSFCNNCGENLNKDRDIIKSLFKHKKRTVIVLSIILICGYFMYFQIGKLILKEKLSGEWSAPNEWLTIDENFMIEGLVFHDNKIDYYSGHEIDSLIIPIETMDYKVVSPNKIKIKGRHGTFKIVFEYELLRMSVYPAITRDSDCEGWNRMTGNWRYDIP